MSPTTPNVCSFFRSKATTDIYTLSLHDALPILPALATNGRPRQTTPEDRRRLRPRARRLRLGHHDRRSEEHTSELQSLTNIVCRLLLEKKNSRLSPESDAMGGTYSITSLIHIKM